MKTRATILAAALALTAAAPLAAQRPGTVEAGLFGNMSWLDQSNSISDVTPQGIGARLGLFVLPNLELEATGSFSDSHLSTAPEQDVNYIPLRALLVYNIGSGDLVPIIGAGASRTMYTGAIDATNHGFAGVMGLKAYYTDWAMLRTEATLDHIPTPFNNTDRHLNWGWNVGVSFAIGSRYKDSDGDGVRDNRDMCLMSARGEKVDATGCAMDTDGDGIADSADRCMDTPAGARVDASGCAIDSDRDGVADHADACPNTAANSAVDAKGCSTDSDGDGVDNADDRCANTPAGVRVDDTGCPRDFDADGVDDNVDKCPNTVRGATVDSTGCPRDSDRDGVADGLDRCPNSAADSEVDARGCLILFDEAKGETVLVLEGVNFETNSARLTQQAQWTLDRVAQSMIGNPDVNVEVAGHTDNTGSRSYNVSLSQRRAESVVSYLVARGVDASRMSARGYGPDKPAATNATRSGRQENRRVELHKAN